MDLTPTQLSSPTFSVAQGGRTIIRFNLRDENRAVVNLTTCMLTGSADDANASKFTDGISNTKGTPTVALVVRDARGGPAPILRVDGSVEDPKTGAVMFVLEPAASVPAGTYDGQVGVFIEGRLFKTWPLLVEITANLFAADAAGTPVDWIRLALRDKYVYDDSLLADKEFSNEEIMHAVRRTIDRWNDTPPLLQNYDFADFPWREKLLVGATGYLYQIAAAKYRRDHLAYAGSGVQVDDKNKAPEYEAISKDRLLEFDTWMSATKHAINAEAFWGMI
jgi:hypothetical protein